MVEEAPALPMSATERRAIAKNVFINAPPSLEVRPGIDAAVGGVGDDATDDVGARRRLGGNARHAVIETPIGVRGVTDDNIGCGIGVHQDAVSGVVEAVIAVDAVAIARGVNPPLEGG